ncbi:hypothetical protein Bca4012_037020 [Brassica carinata]
MMPHSMLLFPVQGGDFRLIKRKSFIPRISPSQFGETPNVKRGGELMGLTCSSLMLRLLSCRPATVFVHRLPAFRQPLKAGSLFTLGGLEMAEGVNLEETQPPPFIADIVGKTYSFQYGDDDDGDDMPGNISALSNIGIDGNERMETLSGGTSSNGPATKKPRLSTTLNLVKKARRLK